MSLKNIIKRILREESEITNYGEKVLNKLLTDESNNDKLFVCTLDANKYVLYVSHMVTSELLSQYNLKQKTYDFVYYSTVERTAKLYSDIILNHYYNICK
jgi:hypothetical protein